MDKSNNSRTIHHLNTQQIDWSAVLIPFVHLGDTDGFHKAFDWNCMNCCITHRERNFRRQINNIWFIWIDLIFNSAWWCLYKFMFLFTSLLRRVRPIWLLIFNWPGFIWMVDPGIRIPLGLGIRYFSFQIAAGWNPQHVAERRWGLRAPPANR